MFRRIATNTIETSGFWAPSARCTERNDLRFRTTRSKFAPERMASCVWAVAPSSDTQSSASPASMSARALGLESSVPFVLNATRTPRSDAYAMLSTRFKEFNLD